MTANSVQIIKDAYSRKGHKIAINITQKQGEPFIIVNYLAFMAIKAYLLHFSYKLLYIAEVIIYAKWNRLIYALLS